MPAFAPPVALALLVATGCARRAPGPEECHALAVRWVSRERGVLSHRFGALLIEPTEDAVLERTTECLTVPYDRELVECVGAGGAPRGCFGAFRSRRAAQGAAASPLELPLR